MNWVIESSTGKSRRENILATKIVAFGRNYKAHANELGNPVPKAPLFFLKPPSSIITEGQTIELPLEAGRVDYEGELALVMADRVSKISPEDALAYVLGYTCANDVSSRTLKVPGEPWSRSKGFDTFLPIGPLLKTDVDPDTLNLITRLNGKVVQETNTRDMIFSVAQLVSYASHSMTLCRGDILLTGTPAGVGPLTEGDEVEVAIEGIGTLKNSVRCL